MPEQALKYFKSNSFYSNTNELVSKTRVTERHLFIIRNQWQLVLLQRENYSVYPRK